MIGYWRHHDIVVRPYRTRTKML